MKKSIVILTLVILLALSLLLPKTLPARANETMGFTVTATIRPGCLSSISPMCITLTPSKVATTEPVTYTVYLPLIRFEPALII